MPELKIPHVAVKIPRATTKTRHRQINKYLKKKRIWNWDTRAARSHWVLREEETRSCSLGAGVADTLGQINTPAPSEGGEKPRMSREAWSAGKQEGGGESQRPCIPGRHSETP